VGYRSRTEKSTEIPENEKKNNAMLPRIENRRGRPRAQYWDDFWIEVALYAAINDINHEQESRTALQRHMQEWSAGRNPPGPDDRTIREKLSSLFAASIRRSG
jgi:hypothetical protein